MTPSTYVWSISSDHAGNAYLGTGAPAAVLKIDLDGKSTTLFETKDLSVQSVRVGPDGAVYAATLPKGKIYRLDAAHSKAGAPENDDTAKVIFDPETTEEKPRYIWDMAFDAQGRLYIAAGGPGAIYRWDPAKPTTKAELFFTERRAAHSLPGICARRQPDCRIGRQRTRLSHRQSGHKALFCMTRRAARLPPWPSLRREPYMRPTWVTRAAINLPPLPVQGVATVNTTITIVQPGSIQTFNGNTMIPDGTEIFEIPAIGSSAFASGRAATTSCTPCAPRPHGLLAATGNRGRDLPY